MRPTRKLAVSAAMFAAALVLVALSAATHSVAPLFGAWVPLVVVPWALTRPGPAWETTPGPSGQAEAGPQGREGSGTEPGEPTG
jgi:hypothetical protein